MHGFQACLLKYITGAALHIYLSVVKMPLKGDVRGHVLNSHGTYIVDRGQSRKNHGIVFLNFCGSPVLGVQENRDLQAYHDILLALPVHKPSCVSLSQFPSKICKKISIICFQIARKEGRFQNLNQ